MPDESSEQHRRADEKVRKKLPPGVKLVGTLRGHTKHIGRIAWSPDRRMLASPSDDRTIRLWDAETGECLRTLEGHHDRVTSAAFHPAGRILASGSGDHTIRLWEPASGKLIRTLEGHKGWAFGVAFDPGGRTLTSASADKTIRLWEVADGRLLRTLEGYIGPALSVHFLFDGRLVAFKIADDTFRLLNSRTGDTLGILEEPSGGHWPPSLAFHPYLPLLATVGSDPGTSFDKRDRLIHIWELDLAVLLGQAAEPSAHYVNAKMVLVGDTGVGKTGLSLVLNNQPYKETDSTAGRHVWTLDSREVSVEDNVTQTRETLLWDLAGQPGYRVIHQLHLNEVAVALVVFGARSETDPLAGVRHWERALRLAQQRQGTAAVPMKKFLVSARNDRGGVSVSKDRIQAVRDGCIVGRAQGTHPLPIASRGNGQVRRPAARLRGVRYVG